MDSAQLKKIAQLSRLKIEDNEIDSMLLDFNKIVNYVDKIKELDVSSITDAELYESHENVFRKDVPGETLTKDQIQNMSPRFENSYIVVPRVIET